MRLSRRASKSQGGFDMTPMIDVVLQLIIFFLYTAHFSAMTRSPVDLPKEHGEEAMVASGAIVIDIDEKGEMRVERSRVTMERIEQLVAVEVERMGGPAAVEVLVRSDRTVSAATINEVARRLGAMGVTNWRLGTADQGG